MLNIEDFKEEMQKRDGHAFGVESATHKVLDCVGYYCNNCLFHGDCKLGGVCIVTIRKSSYKNFKVKYEPHYDVSEETPRDLEAKTLDE